MQKLKLIFWMYLAVGAIALTYGDAYGNAHFKYWDIVKPFLALR